MVEKNKVIDLFCCEGGASYGYSLAGFTPFGVEIDASRLARYRTRFNGIACDWEVGLDIAMQTLGDEVALIHASPPCQWASTATPAHRRSEYADLMNPVLDRLRLTGKPFVIENVPTAFKYKDWEPTLVLRGDMFIDLWWKWDLWSQPTTLADFKGRGLTHREAVERSLNPDGFFVRGKAHSRGYRDRPITMYEGGNFFGVDRPRMFLIEGFDASPIERNIRRDVDIVTITTSPNNTTTWNQLNRTTLTPISAGRIMGGQRSPMEWMSMTGVGESIPPEYTRYIGEQLLKAEDRTILLEEK